MSDLMCKIFGHHWREGWAGAKSSYFGAVVIVGKRCERCGAEEKGYSTYVKVEDFSALSPQKGETQKEDNE